MRNGRTNFEGAAVLATAILFQATSFGIAYSGFALIVPAVSLEFDARPHELLYAVAIAGIVTGIASPFAGRIVDDAPLRRSVAAGAVALGGGLVLLSLSSRIWHVIAIYATLVSAAVLFSGPIPALVLATRWFRHNQGAAIGIVSVGTSLGGVLVPPATLALSEWMGWRAALQALAGFQLAIVLPIVWLFVRDARSTDDGVRAEALKTQSVRLRDIVLRRPFWLILIAMAPMLIMVAGLHQNIALMAGDYGSATSQAAMVMSLMSIAIMTGKLAFGAVGDRLPISLLLATLMLMSGGGSFCLALTDDLAGLIFGSLIVGFATGGYYPAIALSFARTFGGENLGRTLGLSGPIISLTDLGGPVAAQLRTATGDYQIIYFWLGLAILATLPLAFRPGSHGPTAPTPVSPPASRSRIR